VAHRVGALMAPALPAVVRALRPQQWAKNVLVFAAPVAAGRITESEVLLPTLVAFTSFCLLSSGTYLFNDVRDLESDRRHPTKRDRPIASGELSVSAAIGLGIVLVVVAMVAALAVSVSLAATLWAYLALTTAYNFWLKHEPIVDIVAVATGFVLRAVAGAAATDIPLSEWFFIVTCFGALLMVTGKREGERTELGADAAALRPTLGAYSAEFLRFLRGVATSVVLVGYCLWAFDNAAVAGSSGTASVLFQVSILPFSVAILRYALLLDQGRGAEPERLVLADTTLLAAGLCWVVIYGYGVYVT
jgi:decaprenyl-phosphate phosphoribosyltransferase